ncbi:hypothetical protein DA519_21260 [Salmonella enterica]|nr:hypothetical protein [Salmonella enterica]EDU7228246.1 hypothetical protein [Salmonella enterica subsp. enterica serovar Cotham]EDW6396491.1 hypothetical protein [Salmonella enterica subsp. enterica]EGM1709349.1 hypothetical protein [Salmonella enterica subsp. enterica serovar Takoradi]EBD9276491.1 hypothetical protein [Salmonella enterica]
MFAFYKRVFLRLDVLLLKNRLKIQFILLTIITAIGLFLLGGFFVYYNLSKEPENSMIELIYKKCGGNEFGAKDIRGPWSTEQMTCWSEELSHVRRIVFKTEMYFKHGRYISECKTKIENKKECQEDANYNYRKRMEKYREIETLMR